MGISLCLLCVDLVLMSCGLGVTFGCCGVWMSFTVELLLCACFLCCGYVCVSSSLSGLFMVIVGLGWSCLLMVDCWLYCCCG